MATNVNVAVEVVEVTELDPGSIRMKHTVDHDLTMYAVIINGCEVVIECGVPGREEQDIESCRMLSAAFSHIEDGLRRRRNARRMNVMHHAPPPPPRTAHTTEPMPEMAAR